MASKIAINSLFIYIIFRAVYAVHANAWVRQVRCSRNQRFRGSCGRTRARTTPPAAAVSPVSLPGSDEMVWDFEFGIDIGIFGSKYRGIGIGFGIEIGMKSVLESVSNWR